MVEQEVFAQSWVIHYSNEFLHFENRNLLDVSLKQFCFEFLIISRGFSVSLGKQWFDLVKVNEEVTFWFHEF